MFSVDLSTRECDGHFVVELRGALDLADTAGVAAGADLLLAAPRQQVTRVLAVTRLIDDFSVHASMEEAAGRAGRFRRVVVPVRRSGRMRSLRTGGRSASRQPDGIR